jgi:hypothetical protein
MTQKHIDEATASELAARAYLAGISVEEAAEIWTGAAQRDGNYPELTITLSPDEVGRYSVSPLDPNILAMAQRELRRMN